MGRMGPCAASVRNRIHRVFLTALLASSASCVDVDYFAVAPDKRQLMEACFVAYPVHLDYMNQHGRLLGKINTQGRRSNRDEALDAAREECAAHGGTHLVLVDRASTYRGTLVQSDRQTTGEVTGNGRGFDYSEKSSSQTMATPIYGDTNRGSSTGCGRRRDECARHRRRPSRLFAGGCDLG